MENEIFETKCDLCHQSYYTTKSTIHIVSIGQNLNKLCSECYKQLIKIRTEQAVKHVREEVQLRLKTI